MQIKYRTNKVVMHDIEVIIELEAERKKSEKSRVGIKLIISDKANQATWYVQTERTGKY